MLKLEPIQLDFFRTDAECEMIQLREAIDKVRISNDKVRRKLFADNGRLNRGMEDLSSRLEIIERMICRG